MLGLLVAAGAAAMAAGTAAQPATQPLAIEKVADNLHVITGGGGNTAVYVGGSGVVLVDTKLANYGPQILEQVRTVTDKPITHIINTHRHGDHVGSNDFFDPMVEIVAHTETAARMAKMPSFQDAAKKRGLPDRTFTDRLTLLAENDSIDLYYFGRAHTDGDAFVVFRAARVMHAGDVFPGPTSPYIDLDSGGSGLQYPETLAQAAAGIKGIDRVIPGHSGVTSWQAFIDYGAFIQSFVGSVQASVKAGRTTDEALAAFVPADKFKSFDLTFAKASIEALYKELQK